MSTDKVAIINTTIKALPSILALIRGEHVGTGAPNPTDAEMKAALQSALSSSLGVDEAWLADHPDDQKG